MKKDIENSVKILNKGGVVLVHDCLPSESETRWCPGHMKIGMAMSGNQL